MSVPPRFPLSSRLPLCCSLIKGERALISCTAPLLASLAWHLGTELDRLDKTVTNVYEQAKGMSAHRHGDASGGLV